MSHPDDALIEPSIAASAATAISPGPPLSSDAPEAVQEPLRQSGSDKEQPDIEPAEFDERQKLPFEGLLYVGYLEETVEIFGHTFRIATPSTTERLQLGQLHAEYANTLASEIAYQTLMVSAHLRSVDNRELPQPVTNDPKENAVRDRFRWVGENLRQPVIDRLFGLVLELNGKVDKVIAAMGEARG